MTARLLPAAVATVAALASPAPLRAQERAPDAVRPIPSADVATIAPATSGTSLQTSTCHFVGPDGTASARCFDPGFRLYLGGGSEGVEAGIQLRGVARTDDPGTTWRHEHGIARVAWSPVAARGVVYEGRYLRHSREGYLLFPGNPPRHLSVPFDVGLESTVGRIDVHDGEARARLNAGRVALLADLARSASFRRRAAIGAVARWDMVLDRDQGAARLQTVSPFSVGYLSLYAESENGLTLGSFSGELGTTRGVGGGIAGWHRHLTAEATVERVLFALNDRPVSLYLLGRYDESNGRGLGGEVGVRLALLTRHRD